MIPGCLVDVRPIGVLKMIDSGEEDDKVICVPVEDPKFADVESIKDVSSHQIKEIVHFLECIRNCKGKKLRLLKFLIEKMR